MLKRTLGGVFALFFMPYSAFAQQGYITPTFNLTSPGPIGSVTPSTGAFTSLTIPGSAPGSFMMGAGTDPVNRIFDVRNVVTTAKTSFQFLETDPLVTGSTFHYSFYLENNMSGSGNRQLLTSQLLSSAADVNDMLASDVNICKITGGSGNCFGGNLYAWADVGAAITSQVVGLEADIRVDNASVVSKVGVQAIDVATSSGAGAVSDSGFLIGKQPSALGFKNGITFGVNGTTGFGIYERLIYAKPSAQNLTAIADFGGLSGTLTNGIILPMLSDLSFGSGAAPPGGSVVSGTSSNGPRLSLASNSFAVRNTNGSITWLTVSPTQAYVMANTASTSTTTGALRVAGGLGLAGDLFAGASLNGTLANLTTSISATKSTEYPINSVVVTDNGIINPVHNTYGFQVQLLGRGATSNGGQFALGGLAHITSHGDTGMAAGTNFVAGGILQAIGDYDNTGIAGSLPSVFGGNSNVVAMATAKNWGNFISFEADTTTYTGADYTSRVGYAAVLNGNGPQASIRDSGLAFFAPTAVSGYIGWKTLISIDNLSGGSPIDATNGAILKTTGALSFKDGIDISSSTCTGNFLNGPAGAFSVSCTGGLTAAAIASLGKILMGNVLAPTNAHYWDTLINNADGSLLFRALDDTLVATNWLTVARTAGAPTIAVFNEPVQATLYKVAGIQVVTSRNTGWTAMTGIQDKATALDPSTATLVQIAERVSAIQAGLTGHGLIGP